MAARSCGLETRPEHRAKMASKARSDVWQHFEKLDEKTVKCKMCSATLVYNSTTSSMRYHLAHKHKKADDANATTSSQTSIRDFTIRQKCDTGRAEKMTQLIAEMTAEDLLPISFVEGEGFKRLMNYAEPHYTVPSRKTVTARIDALYEKCACSLKDSLSKPARVAITTDSWTSLTAESYMTLTCHYINEWKIHNAVLET